MYCSQCGCENLDTASFCKSCGKPVSRRAALDSVGSYSGRIDGGERVQPAPAYGTSGAAGTGRSGVGASVKLIGALVVTAIAVIVAVAVVGGLGSGAGRSTSGQLAQDLSTSFTRVYSSGFSDSALNTVCNDMIGMMPSEAVDAALEKAGITDRSDVSKLLSGYFSSSSYSSYLSYLEKLDIDCSFFVGDEISSSTLNSINSDLQKAGINVRASSGNKLGMNLRATALEDVQGVSKGESKTQTVQNTGLIAINIDGRWYLWGESLL